MCGSPSFRFVIPSAALDLSCRKCVRHACGCSENRSDAHLTLSVYRCARKISRFARNDDTGKAVIREETSPSFLWKEVPRRGGGWLSQRNERECEIARPLALSSRAQPRDLSCRRENRTYEKVRHSKSYEVRCFPLLSYLLSDRCARKISRFARNDNKGEGLGYGRLSLCFISFYFFSQYATSVSTAPMPRAVLIPMPVYMAKEARVAARLAAISFLKKP